MQLIIAELAKARTRLAEATDPRAKTALEGVVMTLEWVYEDGGRAGPSELAAKFVSDPLDHDGDGEKGGSLPGKRSTRRKAK
jgi:hypothetical protein